MMELNNKIENNIAKISFIDFNSKKIEFILETKK